MIRCLKFTHEKTSLFFLVFLPNSFEATLPIAKAEPALPTLAPAALAFSTEVTSFSIQVRKHFLKAQLLLQREDRLF